MLLAFLAIFGVTILGSLAIGTTKGLLTKNKSQSVESESVDSVETKQPEQQREEEREQEREEERKEEKEEERKEEKEEERKEEREEVPEERPAPTSENSQQPTTQEIELGGPRGVYGPGITKPMLQAKVDRIRNDMIKDTYRYDSLIEEKVKSMGLNPNTDEHKFVLCEAMRRAWNQEVANKNKKLDVFLSNATDDNVNEVASEMANYFTENYSVEGFVDKVAQSSYISKVSERYNSYLGKVNESGVLEFLQTTSDSMSPQVLAPREHALAVMKRNMGYVISGGKNIDNFERDMDADMADIKSEIIATENFITLYNDVFNQGGRIADLEKFSSSAEKWIVSTDRALEEMDKTNSKALEQIGKDIEILEGKLSGIKENETVLGKLGELRSNLNKKYIELVKNLDKVARDSNTNIGAVSKEIQVVKKVLKSKVSAREVNSKFKEFEGKIEGIEQVINERLKKMSEEIAGLTEKVDGINKEANKALEEKIGEFLESDQGMIMFANNFAAMMKSRNPEVKKIVEGAIVDKIKRYLNTKGGKERLDPIIINKFNALINDTEITNNIVSVVIQKIQENQIIVSGNEETKDSNIYVNVNGNVYGADLESILAEVVTVTVNGKVYSNLENSGQKK